MHIIKNYLVFILLVIVILFFGIKQTIPVFNSLIQNINTVNSLQEEIDILNQQIEDLKRSQSEKQNKAGMKPFFKNTLSTSDPLSSFVPMFEDIISFIKQNEIRINSIEYNLSPSEDIFYTGAKDKYDVCEINMILVGNYTQIKTFLNLLYSYQYFLNINKIEVYPYQKNKNLLITNFSIILYIQK